MKIGEIYELNEESKRISGGITFGEQPRHGEDITWPILTVDSLDLVKIIEIKDSKCGFINCSHPKLEAVFIPQTRFLQRFTLTKPKQKLCLLCGMPESKHQGVFNSLCPDDSGTFTL